MKKFVSLFFFLCLALTLTSCFSGNTITKQQNNDDDKVLTSHVNPTFSRGAWVATVWGIDFPSNPTTDDTTLKTELDTLVTKAVGMGLDALFFQVRPTADALYNSVHFPWSRHLTGKQGLVPKNNFDPLEHIIDKCHTNGIQLHAWINPYRITVLTTDVLTAEHPATLIPWITMNVGGKKFFNPGEFVARELIVEGVREIVENYNVDGIHFDDYFYPEGITDQDAFTFAGKWTGPDKLDDWRRWNVDQLVRQTKQVIHETAPNVVFGISPSGIWANKSNNPQGSDTRGFESYNAIYADSRGWVKNGWVDYIVPQIYWKIGQPGSDFATVLNWWHDVCAGTDVALYAGLAGHKVTDGTFTPAEILDQINLASQLADGVVVFSLKDLLRLIYIYKATPDIS